VLLFQGGVRCVVNTKKETKRNQWAKVRITGGPEGDEAAQQEMRTGELMELLGPVGDFDTELYAYQLHFNILPCRYPTADAWGLLPAQVSVRPHARAPARVAMHASAGRRARPRARMPRRPRAREIPAADAPVRCACAQDVDALSDGRQDCTHLHVFSIDNASTRDIDDALSFEFQGGDDAATCRIGIHVADVAARVPTNSPLFEWARLRASSAYHHGPSDDGVGGGSVPMMPPQLAHGALSLTEGQPRPAVTLWLYVEMGCIVKREHTRTLIVNKCATTYSIFTADEEPSTVRARGLLQMLSGESLAEDLVAWTMVEYNGYFGALLAQRAAAAGSSEGQGLLRVQEAEDKGAVYALASPSGGQGHKKLGLDTYAHMSSPIRRFSDLFNQHVLFETLSASVVHPVLGALAGADASAVTLGDEGVATLNLRCGEIKRYHSVVDAMSLGYACRGTPRYFSCKVEASEDGRSLMIYAPEKRLRVNLRDTYFATSLQDRLAVGYDGPVELCGILKAGRTQLRVRLPEVVAPSREAMGDFMVEQLGKELKKSASMSLSHGGGGGGGGAPVFKQVGGGKKVGRDTSEAVTAGMAEAAGGVEQSWAEEERDDDEVVVEDEAVTPQLSAENFEEACELANGVMGYPIDDFQQRCLRVILQSDTDLLAMAPTGSGKTAVALLAILQAFARGKRAVYTSPIKALSNQKFAEFKEWFRRKGVKGEVSLLTGDIKIRAPPGTKNELIICTSEILRNKLVKASGVAQGMDPSRLAPDGGGQLQGPDPDLERLGCVVSDEVHYINDPERGSVWEETLMHLSQEVQLVALSATLRRPEVLCVFVYMCVCVYVYMYVCMYVCMYR